MCHKYVLTFCSNYILTKKIKNKNNKIEKIESKNLIVTMVLFEINSMWVIIL